MQQPLNPSLLRIPLLSNPALCQQSQDPQEWANTIHSTTPLRICEPVQTKQPFHNATGFLNLGTVALLATQGSPVTVVTDQHPCAQLMLPYRGNGWWKIESTTYANHVGEAVLYLPPAPLRLDNTCTSGVALYLDLDCLIDTALTMAGPEGLKADLGRIVQQPQSLPLSNPQAAPIINAIYTLMLSIDQVASQGAFDPTLLRFDDLLNRMVVLLLCPELQRSEATGAISTGSSSDTKRLQPLLEWIDAHLAQPIALSDLERQVNWSRRTLQYAFRSAFDCTPMQWVRNLRLQKAMQRLTTPLPGDSVSSIAESVGLVCPISFSRDFRKRYGCTPSSILRG